MSDSSSVGPAGFLLPALVSAASALLAHILRLPSHLFLVGLHSYVLPDSLPADSPAALLLPPSSSSSSPQQQHQKHQHQQNQLLRLRLSLSDLPSRPHFPSFHSSLLLPLPSLLLLLPIPLHPPTFLPFLLSFLSILLLLLLLPPSPTPSPSPSSLPLLSLPFLFLLPSPTPSPSPTAIAIAIPLSFFLLRPSAALSARAFWLASDQPRLRLPVLSPSSPLPRLLLLLPLLSPLLLSLPLAIPPLLHLLSLRIALQSFLNEPVLSWYQRLHSPSPDLAYSRAKLFLHDRRLCAAAARLLAPPLLALLLLGVSRLRGNLFPAAPLPFSDTFRSCSDPVKDAALFLSWWITFAGSVLTLSHLALYRLGWLFIS